MPNYLKDHLSLKIFNEVLIGGKFLSKRCYGSKPFAPSCIASRFSAEFAACETSECDQVLAKNVLLTFDTAASYQVIPGLRNLYGAMNVDDVYNLSQFTTNYYLMS